MSAKEWYRLEPEEVAGALKTDLAQGLRDQEAAGRLARYGPNRLREKPGVAPWSIFLAQFKDFMVLVLVGATLISGILGEYADALTILVIVVLNAVLGFVQEYRAEHSLEALRRLTAPEARVVRDGEAATVPAATVVPGDILLLETGDRVPADARLVGVTCLETDEAALTGESLPVAKRAIPMDEARGLGDRKNEVFLGTVVTRGRGRAVVTATGMATEMGRIAGMIQEVGEEATPLQRRLAQMGRLMVWSCLGICALVVAVGVLRGEALYQMFLAGVSLAVAAIPEGLPAIVTIALALGVQRMIRRHAIIRKLPAVETLGCATCICSDKTGTLTENKMTVRRLFQGGDSIEVTGQGYAPRGEFLTPAGAKADPAQLRQLLQAAALCNNAGLKKNGLALGGLFRRQEREQGRGDGDSQWEVAGDPTEGALLVAAAKAGIWREVVEKQQQRLAEVPFDAERKRMTVVYRDGEGRVQAYCKGAPDVVLDLCRQVIWQGRVQPLTPAIRAAVMAANEAMAGEALRVLALACRDLPAAWSVDQPEQLEAGLTLIGLAGMIDPPRPAAVRAIEVCRQAGIKTVMITGDHQATALAIAREMRLGGATLQAMSGVQLDALGDAELERVVEDVAVYARVSPKHKLRIVRALKARGHVVAMTGDGVNDAPAVKEADIGVAMGKTGTDVTKEAAAMILADDNFATIVAAVEEGRAIYDNIRKFIRYLLSCNIGEVLTMFVAIVIGLPLPLLPMQILWVNLVTDGLPAMALGVDRADTDLMSRRPRHPRESIFSRGLGAKILGRGIQIGVGTIAVFALALYLGDGDLVTARTMAFATLVFSQLFHVFDCKSEQHSVFEVGVFSNLYLVGAVGTSIVLELAAIYLPALQPLFKTTALGGFQWSIILVAAGWRTFLAAARYYLWRPVRRRLVYLRT